MSKTTVHVVSHSHWDREWYMSFERHHLKLVRLMDELCRLFDEDPEFKSFYLDGQTIILEDYLDCFEGAVVVASHDRFFLDRVVDHILEFQGEGRVETYLGGYTDYFETLSSNLLKKAEREEPRGKTEKPRPEDRPRKLKFSFKEEREFQTIDGDIAALEGELAALEGEIEAKAADYEALQDLLARKEELQAALDGKMERWVYLNDLAEQIARQ